jgi:hypothetical protein
MKTKPRDLMKKQLSLMLGDGLIDVELDNLNYELSIDLAIDRLRQRSDGSTSEQVVFLTLDPDVTTYKLPDIVQIPKKITRRSSGTVGSSGINFDPFDGAMANLFYLQWGRTGGILTWELLAEYKETINRLFTGDVGFSWNGYDKTLTIHRRPHGNEVIMVIVEAMKTEDEIISGIYTKPWIRDYALAQCKFMLGEAREKYPGGFPGPSGAVVLNGSQMKQEALAEMQRLEVEIQNFVTGDIAMPFMIA